ASLLEANLSFLARRGLASYVALGAELGPAVALERSVVCRGARVRGEGALSECLICEGAEATAPLERAIVTPSGRIIPTHAALLPGCRPAGAVRARGAPVPPERRVAALEPRSAARVSRLRSDRRERRARSGARAAARRVAGSSRRAALGRHLAVR